MKVKIKECPKCKKNDVVCERISMTVDTNGKSFGAVDGNKQIMKLKCGSCNKDFERTLHESTVNNDEVIN